MYCTRRRLEDPVADRDAKALCFGLKELLPRRLPKVRRADSGAAAVNGRGEREVAAGVVHEAGVHDTPPPYSQPISKV